MENAPKRQPQSVIISSHILKNKDPALTPPPHLIIKPISLGGLAQLGERLTGSQKVVGSIPISSTTFFFKITHIHWVFITFKSKWVCR